jgi:signal transduction histidine kinase
MPVSTEHVVAFSPVPPLGWGLVVEESWEMVANPTLRISQLAPLVLVPVLLIALAGLWFGVRQVIYPLQELEEQAASISWGNYQAIEKPVGGIGEIRHLQAELVHLTHKIQAAQQSLHDYIGAITAGQEDERRRLARELHDDTIQALIALKQRVQLAHLSLEGQPAGQAMAELETLTEQAIENLRRLTRALRPIYLEDLGLATALEMLVKESQDASGCRIDFIKKGSEIRLEPEVELALYRMAQEALSNIARHAQANQATLCVAFQPQEVKLEVSDNGRGFQVPKSPAEFAPSGHFGLLGMNERAELIGARLEIQSAPGQGTRLTICLPLPAA